MATGAHHYQQAEALIGRAHDFADQHPDCLDRAEFILARAQIHATLALAAAAIEPAVQALARGEGTDQRIITEWAEAVSG